MSYSLDPGTTPLVVSLPHVGTRIPSDQWPRYAERAIDLEDTDWHLDRLYEFVRERGASMIVPNHSRYLIDLNRPPDNAPMYPGANNTELCPTKLFNGEPLYRKGQEPDAAEVERRKTRYWQPYHDALAEELARVKGEFGYALLLDAHSIRSIIPWLFVGKLPDWNLGTADGASCAASLKDSLSAALAGQASYAVDGRFKGGYITRHYGRPGEGVHAVQMEMCQSLYTNEKPPFDFDEAKAAEVRPVLEAFVDAMLNWDPDVA